MPSRPRPAVQHYHGDQRDQQRQHERGHAVHVYTVDEPDDIRRCLEAGIDGIITNRPAVVREAVAAVWDSR